MAKENRTNPVRTKLRAGQTCFGLMAFEFFVPGLSQIAANAGAEFIIFDMEHSGTGIDTIKAQVGLARGTGVVPLVRVPGLHYHLVAPVLDAGAMGVMVPMIETREQAEKLAQWCRYRPEGVRGLGFGFAHDDYKQGADAAELMKHMNERTLVIALVETAEGIRNIDQIAAVDGIDLVWLGHFDLTNTMGITGKFDAPEFHAAVAKLLEACKRHNKAAGILVATPQAGRDWIAKGFRAICYGNDVAVFHTALASGIAAMKA